MRTPALAATPRRQLGLSLIEAAMVLAIAALVVAGVMLFFQSASNSQKTNDALAQLAAIQQATRSLYSGQPDYTGLSASLLANSKQLPNRMVRGTGATATLQHAFNGPVAVAPANSNQHFTVQFSGIPVDACSKMATMDLGTGLYSIKVGSSAAVQGRTLRPDEANASCGTANDAAITWTFF